MEGFSTGGKMKKLYTVRLEPVNVEIHVIEGIECIKVTDIHPSSEILSQFNLWMTSNNKKYLQYCDYFGKFVSISDFEEFSKSYYEVLCSG